MINKLHAFEGLNVWIPSKIPLKERGLQYKLELRNSQLGGGGYIGVNNGKENGNYRGYIGVI